MADMRKPDLLALLLAATIVCGCKPPARSGDAAPTDTATDEQYVSALATVDAFCQAWRQGDEMSARRLLSKQFLRTWTDSQITDAIVARPGPAHAAYEIASGRRVSDGRYTFGVRLYFAFSGEHGDRIEPEQHDVVAVLDEQGQWKVDRFPVPATPAGADAAPLVSPAAKP
jgi:hypothetical protein